MRRDRGAQGDVLAEPDQPAGRRAKLRVQDEQYPGQAAGVDLWLHHRPVSCSMHTTDRS